MPSYRFNLSVICLYEQVLISFLAILCTEEKLDPVYWIIVYIGPPFRDNSQQRRRQQVLAATYRTAPVGSHEEWYLKGYSSQ